MIFSAGFQEIGGSGVIIAVKTIRLASLLLSFQGLMAAEPAPGPGHPVDRMLGIKLPGKIEAVSWSIQESASTVQLILPSVRDGEPLPPVPSTQVWLLRSDGTAISQSAKPSTPAIGMAGSVTQSVLYAFPATAATEAVAVVVTVDGRFFVEPLPTKPQGPAVPPRTEAEAAAVATNLAQEKGIKLSEYQPPKVDFDAGRREWSFFYQLKPPGKPGGHFSITVDENGKTRFMGGK